MYLVDAKHSRGKSITMIEKPLRTAVLVSNYLVRN